MNVIKTKYYASPIGDMLIGSYGTKLCLCDWTYAGHCDITIHRIQKYLNADIEFGNSEVIKQTINQLDEFFCKQRSVFDIPLIFVGSEFQKMVWNSLCRIPYGSTISYSELAKNINKSSAVRAVATAVASNALPIIVPCHRVIGADRKLKGYSGSIDLKEKLLSIETGCLDFRFCQEKKRSL